MDWKTEMHSNLWVFPKGMERNGETGTNTLKWTSKYGSVVTSAFEIASTDGMNEKGLVANLLWLPEAEYPILLEKYFHQWRPRPRLQWRSYPAYIAPMQ